jgi:hypothetical protein
MICAHSRLRRCGTGPPTQIPWGRLPDEAECDVIFRAGLVDWLKAYQPPPLFLVDGGRKDDA